MPNEVGRIFDSALEQERLSLQHMRQTQEQSKSVKLKSIRGSKDIHGIVGSASAKKVSAISPPQSKWTMDRNNNDLMALPPRQQYEGLIRTDSLINRHRAGAIRISEVPAAGNIRLPVIRSTN